MGAKAKTALKKRMKKVSSAKESTDLAKAALTKKTQKVSSASQKESTDFLPIEGGPGRQIVEKQEHNKSKDSGANKSTVVYIGRIPHGFYEKEMEAYFVQFGAVKRLRIARNKKTGKSKHYGFIEFESPEVAEVVADCMNNYLLFEHLLQVHLVPTEHVHPKLWRGFNYRYTPVDRVQTERQQLNKDRTFEEHQKLVERIMKRDKKRQRMIEAAGLDYECPEIVGHTQNAPKKIKFSQD